MHSTSTYSLREVSSVRNELFGLSILSIMLLHYFQDVKELGSTMLLRSLADVYGWWIGAVGVDIFLFLSGMGLYYSMMRDPDVGHFYQKRFIRILPSYLIVGAAFWGIRAAITGGTFTSWWKNLFFVTFFTQGRVTLWFIFFILVMYLIYPLVHALLNSTESDIRRTIRFLVLAAFFIVLSFWGLAHWGKDAKSYDIVIGRIPIFLLGAYLGKYIMEGKSLNRRLAAILFTLFCAAGIVLRYYDSAALVRRYLDIILTLGYIGLSTMFIGLQEQESWNRRFLRLCGSYSLELYLTHVCVRNLAKAKDYPTNHYWVYAIVILISVVLSIPLHALGSRLSRKINPPKTKPASHAG